MDIRVVGTKEVDNMFAIREDGFYMRILDNNAMFLSLLDNESVMILEDATYCRLEKAMEYYDSALSDDDMIELGIPTSLEARCKYFIDKFNMVEIQNKIKGIKK